MSGLGSGAEYVRVAVETMGEGNTFLPLLLKTENSTVEENYNVSHVRHLNFSSSHIKEVKRGNQF